MLRRALSLLLATLTVAGGLTLAASSAHAGPGESGFVSSTNSARTSRGLRALSVRSDLVSVARIHSAKMAAKGDIWHNPSLGSAVSGWQSVGENVGMGGGVSDIQPAFMASPAHRANILDRSYNEIGVGTATDAAGTVYVTVVFRQSFASSVSAPAPQRSTTTTTRPATTTTSRPASRPASRPSAAARPAARRAAPAAAAPATPARPATRPAASAPATRATPARPAAPAAPAAEAPGLDARLTAAHNLAARASTGGVLPQAMGYLQVMQTLAS